MKNRTLTGRHVLVMFVGGFGIIIAANLTLAFNAVRTFPGLEVANSYVASQSFDARRAEQEALGWGTHISYESGVLHLDITTAAGEALDPSQFSAVIGRPTTRAADIQPVFDSLGNATVDLAPGRWRLDLQAERAGHQFSQALLLEIDE